MRRIAISLLYGWVIMLCPALTLNAQETAPEGYMVTHGNDTIRGNVDVTGWGTTPQRFRLTAGDGTVLEATPSTTGTVFILPDLVFETHRVAMDLSPYKTADIMENKALRQCRDIQRPVAGRQEPCNDVLFPVVGPGSH